MILIFDICYPLICGAWIQWLRRHSQETLIIEFRRGNRNIQAERTGIDTLNAFLALIAFLSIGIGGYNQITPLPETLDGFGVGKPGTLQCLAQFIGKGIYELTFNQTEALRCHVGKSGTIGCDPIFDKIPRSFNAVLRLQAFCIRQNADTHIQRFRPSCLLAHLKQSYRRIIISKDQNSNIVQMNTGICGMQSKPILQGIPAQSVILPQLTTNGQNILLYELNKCLPSEAVITLTDLMDKSAVFRIWPG